MMLAARMVAYVMLTVRLDHPADLYGSLVPVRPALREGGAHVDPHAAELLRLFAPAVVLTAEFAAAGSIAYAEIADTADSRVVSSNVHCRGSCMHLRRVNRYGTIASGTIAAGSASLSHSGTGSTRLAGGRSRSTRSTRTASVTAVAKYASRLRRSVLLNAGAPATLWYAGVHG